LHETTLNYYAKEGDAKEKKTIDFMKGRGVRAKKECNIDDDWPGNAKHCFGVATEGISTEMILQMLSEYSILLLLAAVVLSFVPVVTGRHRSKHALTKLVTEYCQ